MRVREYGRPAMTLGVLAAILAAVPLGIASPWQGAGFLRSGALAEEAAGGDAASGKAGDAARGSSSGRHSGRDSGGNPGSGNATTGAGAAGRHGNVDGSRGSGGVSAERSAKGRGGNEADAAGSAADDDHDGSGGDRGGASAAGEPSAAESSAGSPAGGVEADGPGGSREITRGAATIGGFGLPAAAAGKNGADAEAPAAAPAETPAETPNVGAEAPAAPGAVTGGPPATGAGTGAGPAGADVPGAEVGGVNGVGAPATGGKLGATRGLAPIREQGGAPAAPVGALRAVRVERNADGIAVVYSNRVRERIVGGRQYQMTDAAGNVVAERPATPRDIERVQDNVRLSGLVPVSEAALPAGSDVEWIAVTPDGMAVRYRAGWTEDLSGGRFRFTDPDGNTVVDRPATLEDRNRLLAIAGG